jgi:ABC-type sugar transport system ATPase subunit
MIERPAMQVGDAVVEVQRLGVEFPGVPALDDVHFDVRNGEVQALPDAIAAGIGFLHDDRKRAGILPDMSAEQNLGVSWLQAQPTPSAE